MPIYNLFDSFSYFLLNCKSIQIESPWTDRTITIDGKALEWNSLILYPKDSKFGVGVMNDDKFLYLCMTSWDRKVTNQIMRAGFTTWFETKNGKGKRFGIHYPLGMAKSGFHHGMEQDPEMMKEKIEESLEHIEILGPGKEDTCPTRTIITESMGVVARIVFSEENCVYELKVPLNQDSINKFAINAGKERDVTMELRDLCF